MRHNQSESGAAERHSYVVDHTYSIVHADKRTRELYPGMEIGSPCFKALRNRERPCPDCPWDPEAGQSLSQAVVFNQILDRWHDLICIETEWPGHGDCALFVSQPISASGKSMFLALTKDSSYEELIEVDLNDGTYWSIYQDEELFEQVPSSGNAYDMVSYAADHLVHPDDREQYLAFWDFCSITQRLADVQGSLRCTYRKKLKSGSWIWTIQTIVSVVRNPKRGPVLMAFASSNHGVNTFDDPGDRADRAEVPHFAETDPLTGLPNTGAFMRRATKFVSDNPERLLEFLYLDIENFKIYNEWYGREAGDALLVDTAERLHALVRKNDGLVGYLGGDDFVAILPFGTVLSGEIAQALQKPSSEPEGAIGFQPAIGVCAMQGIDTPIRTICDHALTALLSIKGSYRKRLAWYSEEMTQRLEESPKVIIEIQEAIENKELVLYWQPQCDTETQKIVGVEALVRWEHPERGIVPPGEFIPILERSGLIANLDLYVWEEACRHIKEWLDQGIRPIPASVNISRDDLYTIDVVASIIALVEKYGLERSMLEVEITESSYAEDERMIEVVDRFKEEGFTVFIDDFGSGYSSLNILREIKADVIKIDMKFLDMDEDTLKRGQNILESIVSMTHLMELSVVAEGAETQEQVDFLKSIGCRYAQGYYFHPPIPASEFDEIIKDPNAVDYSGICFNQLELIEVHDIFDNNLANRSVIDNIVGAMAVYAVSGDAIEVIKVNKQYYHIMRSTPNEAALRSKNVLSTVHPDDVPIIYAMIEQAEKHIVTGATGTVRRFVTPDDMMWLHMKAFYLRDEGDRKLFYTTLLDITHEKEQEIALRESQNALMAVLGIDSSDLGIDRITHENQQIAAGIFSEIAPSGFLGTYCEPNDPLFFANSEMTRMLGYASYNELHEATKGMFKALINPDDYAKITEDLPSKRIEGSDYTTQYRVRRKDGSWMWIVDRGRVVRTESDKLAYASVCVDITETVRMQREIEIEDHLFKSVIRQAKMDVWLYDIATGMMTFQNVREDSLAAAMLPSQLIGSAHETLEIDFETAIEIDGFPEKSQATIKKMFDGIRRGKGSECTVLARFAGRDDRWVKISSEVLLDEEGKPMRAIGYIEEIDEGMCPFP